MRVKCWKVTEADVIAFYFKNINDPWFSVALGADKSADSFIAQIRDGRITYSGIRVKLIEKNVAA